jgi:hypothetical protein
VSTTSPTIEKARVLLRERRSEIRAELEQIEEALGSLEGKPQSKRGPGRPRKGATAKSSKGGKRRRSRKGGTRAEHALRVVTGQPGATASEIAKALGIKPNYVYRVMGDLVDDGHVAKRGKGFYPTEDAGAGTEPEPAAESEPLARSES